MKFHGDYFWTRRSPWSIGDGSEESRGTHEGGGAPYLLGVPPTSWPPRGPLTCSRLQHLLYNPKLPERNLDREFPRQKPPEPPKTNLDPFQHPPEEGIPLWWPSSSSWRSPRRGGSSSPSGLRVCTSSYVFDLSLSLVFLSWHDLDVSRALLLYLDLMMFLPLYSLVMN